MIGFLSGLFDMDKIKSVLIVLPVAVMVNWENEFNKWSVQLSLIQLTSVVQTLMARLPRCFELVLGSLGTNPIVADLA